MINILQVAMIPGIMVGIEWDYENKFIVLDLFIIRLIWDYWPYEREEAEGENKD